VRIPCVVARQYCDARFRVIQDVVIAGGNDERNYGDTSQHMKAVA
jgi:hypothetical protein